MSVVTRPRGPLPPRVYWTRRAILVGVVGVLIVVVARLLGAGGDGKDDEAARTSSESSETSTDETNQSEATTGAETSTGEPDASAGATSAEPTTEPTTEPPAQPDGECSAEDVVIDSRVDTAVAGSPVTVVLSLTTRESAACYWTVSPETSVVKITSGDEDIWSTQHCPDALAESDLVVRKAEPTEVSLDWPAWRSGADCTNRAWSLPGAYHIEAAPLAGEPTDTQFELVAPEPEVIERTVDPSATATE